MIESIWNKKIVMIIEMEPEDVCDHFQPLPLMIEASWNHYIGFYHETIINFFMAYAPLPLSKEQFHLKLIKQQNNEVSQQIIDPGTILSHLYQLNELSYCEPLRFRCGFRCHAEQQRDIDLKRVYKNSLKNSTSLRYPKQGAKIITVEMSTANIDSMFQSFKSGRYNSYLGSYNFQSDNLGYSFLIHTAEKVPIRILGKDILIERSSDKQKMLKDFLLQIVQAQTLRQITIKLHGIVMSDYQIQLWNLEKYCHPDGFLYFYIS